MPDNGFSGKISQEQLNALLKMASSKLGMSSSQLKSTLSDPKSAEELLGKVGGKDAFQSAKNNPGSLEQLIKNNPQARKLLNDLLGDKKNG